MKWFDTKEIKNKESLSEEQIAYLKESSLTIFGPFNVLVRKQWDILLLGFVLAFMSNDDFYNGLEKIVSIPYITLIISFIALIASIFLIYFAIVHGRRLAWNRNKWESFEAFKLSEKKWNIWGQIFFAILLISFAINIFALIYIIFKIIFG